MVEAQNWYQIVGNGSSQRFSADSNWWVADKKEGKHGADYRAANPSFSGAAAWYKFNFPRTTSYDVYVWHPIGGNTSMPFGVYSPTNPNAESDGMVWTNLNLQVKYGKWRYVGRYDIPQGDYWGVACSRWSNQFGVVLADAVKVVEVVEPPKSDPFKDLVNDTRMLVGKAPSGYHPYLVTGYNTVLWNGDYPFGCTPGRDPNTGKILGDSKHKGYDYGWWSKRESEEAKGAPVYAWAKGEVLYNRYHSGGYNRYIGVYYPEAGANGKTVEYGHLMNGSVAVTVGSWFEPGQLLGKIGTWQDGLTYSHVHIRCGNGRITTAIGSCGDEHPLITWDALGLPRDRT